MTHMHSSYEDWAIVNLHVHGSHLSLLCNSMAKFRPHRQAKGHEAGNIFPAKADLLNSNNLGCKALRATALRILPKCIKTSNNFEGVQT